MTILITGSSGYVASHLVKKLESVNHKIIQIHRKQLYDIDSLKKIIPGVDTIIHLAGAPILQRWNRATMDEILKSRVIPTRNLVEVINQLPTIERPKSFIAASAVGIYEASQLHTEKSKSFAGDFAGKVVQQWEDASANLDHSVRKVIFRMGVVIGKDSQTIRKIVPTFKLGLGGKIGSGTQPFPFVHIEDVVNSFFWACQNNEVAGIFNLVAPENIDNALFTKVLARELGRPAFFTIPESALRLVYGEAASLLYTSPQAYPERLLDYGFRFKYPDITSSLDEILK